MSPSGQSWLHPDQVIDILRPVATEAMRVFDAGATLPSTLTEALLTAYLIGRGMAPATAAETVTQWRLSGRVRGLVRSMRTPAVGAGAEAPTMPAPATSTPAAPAQFETRPATQAPGLTAQRLEKFMQDQATAAAFYGALIEQVADPALKDYIEHARDDEQKHYRMLNMLYRDLTGRSYQVQAQPVEFATPAAGLKRAMDDEYEAFEEYRAVYLGSDIRRVRDVFFELMTDELEHATRFNYVLQVLQAAGE